MVNLGTENYKPGVLSPQPISKRKEILTVEEATKASCHECRDNSSFAHSLKSGGGISGLGVVASLGCVVVEALSPSISGVERQRCLKSSEKDLAHTVDK